MSTPTFPCRHPKTGQTVAYERGGTLYTATGVEIGPAGPEAPALPAQPITKTQTKKTKTK